MKDVRSLIVDVLQKCFFVSIATVDKNGPWVANVMYTSDEKLNIYWASRVDSRHSKAIINGNDRVAGTITLTTNPKEDWIGLQIEGKAGKIENFDAPTIHPFSKDERIPEKQGRKRSPEWYMWHGGSVSREASWFILKPRKIELIYEPVFGMVKKEYRITR